MIRKQMNLLPMKYQEIYMVDVDSFLKKVGITLALLVTLVLISLATYQMYNAKLDLVIVENQHALLKDQVRQIDNLRSELKTLETEWGKNALLVQKDVSFSRILRDIHANTPTDIWYTNLAVSLDDSRWEQLMDYSPDASQVDPELLEEYRDQFEISSGSRALVINGYGQSFSSVGALAYLLNQIEYLDNMTINFSREIEIEEQKLVEFSLQGNIKEMKE